MRNYADTHILDDVGSLDKVRDFDICEAEANHAGDRIVFDSSSQSERVPDGEKAKWESFTALTIRVALAIYESGESLKQRIIERLVGVPPSSQAEVLHCLEQLQDVGSIDYEPCSDEALRNSSLRSYFSTESVSVVFLRQLLENTEYKERSAQLSDNARPAGTFSRKRTTVDKLLSHARESMVDIYVAIFIGFAKYGEMTAEQAAALTEDSIQTQYARLKRLMEKGFIVRMHKFGKSGHKKYYYRLSFGVREEVIALMEANDIELSEVKTKDKPSLSIVRSRVSDIVVTQDTEGTQPSVVGRLIDKAPELDANWSEELKISWMQMYQQLIAGCFHTDLMGKQ